MNELDKIDKVIERESLFLNTVLQNRDRLIYANARIDPVLLSPQNSLIYKAAQDIIQDGRNPSFESVIYHLNEKNMLSVVGGLEYINAIRVAGFDMDDGTFQQLVDDIERYGKVQRMKEVVLGIAEKVEESVQPEDLASRLISGIYEVTQKRMEGTISIGDALDSEETRECITDTPLSELNNLLTPGGWALGDYVIIAARPSVGKTALAMQMAVRAAANGVPVLVYSMEQSKKTLMNRLRHTLDPDILRVLPLYFNFTVGLTAQEIFYNTQVAQMLYNIQLVVVDYIGLIRGREKSESRNDFLTRVSEKFMVMRKNLNLVLIVVSQLNRDPDREQREPELHDLRDAGSLEQDADVVLLLHRPGKAETAKIKVAKQREGRLGAFQAWFDPQRMLFSDA